MIQIWRQRHRRRRVRAHGGRAVPIAAQAWPTHSTCLVRSVGKISFHATLGINSGARDVTRCALLCPAGVSPRRLWQRSDAFRVCCWRISRACLGSGSSIRMPDVFPRHRRFVRCLDLADEARFAQAGGQGDYAFGAAHQTPTRSQAMHACHIKSRDILSYTITPVDVDEHGGPPKASGPLEGGAHALNGKACIHRVW